MATLPTPRTASEKQKIRIDKMNNQVQLGTHLLLSGFLTKTVSDIQQENTMFFYKKIEKKLKKNFVFFYFFYLDNILLK